MPEPLTVAAMQPDVLAGDLRATVRAHVDCVQAARARLVVFPELSLTGYKLDAPAVPVGDVLQPLIDACSSSGAVALVGAPVVEEDGRYYVAMLRVDADGARTVYRKTWLDGSEERRFSRGDGPTVLDIDGWRVGVGICKDTGAAQHTAATAALSIDAYVAGLVHRPEELPEQDARGFILARSCEAWVVFSSFAGRTGDDFDVTAGCSTVWAPNGRVVGRAGPAPGDFVRATLTACED